MDEAPWLDDEEQQVWMALVTTMHHLPEVLDRQLKRDSRVAHGEYLILAMLSEAADRTLTMTRLARRLQFSASRLSHTAAKLERLGLIRRHKDPGNARVSLATLIDSGFSTLADAVPATRAKYAQSGKLPTERHAGRAGGCQPSSVRSSASTGPQLPGR